MAPQTSVPAQLQVFWPYRVRRLRTGLYGLKSSPLVGYARHADVINGVHALVFNKDADAVRAFFRDVLGFASARHLTAIQPKG